MTDWGAFLLVVAIPAVGAALGIAIWSKPKVLKSWALLISLATLAMMVTLSQQLAGSVVGIALLILLPMAAFLSLLGQPAHGNNRMAWVMTLLLLGLGLGVLVNRDRVGLIVMAVILILIGLLIHRYRAMSVYRPGQGIGTCAFGIICLIVALVTARPVSVFAFVTACAILLPLVPFHGGYVAALAGLPGNLPAFLAFLLPVLGFHGLLAVRPNLPETATNALMVLGVAGALYGAFKALAQTRVRSVLAYANLSFYSILWWYVAVSPSIPPHANVYLSAIGLATTGVLLGWYAIQARYGDMDLRAIRGLAYPMPRFAVLFALLILAALGLPPFGVFAGFMGLLLTPGLPLSGALAVVVLVWLSASWYLLDLLQRLLFGRHRADLRYEDLGRAEFASLLALVLLLCAMGLAPPHVFQPGAQAGM